MSESFVLENEPWFQEMIETKKFPVMMVPPRMGEHPVRNGKTVKWVKTFWQEMGEKYGLRWPTDDADDSPEEEVTNEGVDGEV